MSNTARPSFMNAMKSTFALPGQTALAFGKEMKELSQPDRQYFSKLLSENGVEHDPPAGIASAA